MPKSDDDTLVRMIKAESKLAATDVYRQGRADILDAIKESNADIKTEMHTHFAKLSDLLDWELKLHQTTDTKMRDLIKEHRAIDHKVSMMPKPPGVKTRITSKQLGALITVLGALTAAVWALVST
ncbi:MAG: hypothetical protein GY847_28795 [Proteobacteria bacterium]|nr:hypothetical protein [Pseudomonadota bacterium]